MLESKRKINLKKPKPKRAHYEHGEIKF